MVPLDRLRHVRLSLPTATHRVGKASGDVQSKTPADFNAHVYPGRAVEELLSVCNAIDAVKTDREVNFDYSQKIEVTFEDEHQTNRKGATAGPRAMIFDEEPQINAAAAAEPSKVKRKRGTRLNSN